MIAHNIAAVVTTNPPRERRKRRAIGLPQQCHPDNNSHILRSVPRVLWVDWAPIGVAPAPMVGAAALSFRGVNCICSSSDAVRGEGGVHSSRSTAIRGTRLGALDVYSADPS